MHGGNAPQVRAKAAVRAEVQEWVIGDPVDDPGETLLRLITQSRRRVDTLGEEIARKVAAGQEEAGDDFTLESVLIGERWVSGADGEVHQTGEYIRGLVRLEEEERDRLGTFTSKALAADIMVKRAAAEERLAEILGDMMSRVVDDPRVALTAAQRAFLLLSLREVTGNQPVVRMELE